MPTAATFPPCPALSGWRVVITRAATQAQDLADLLTAHGAVPVFYPTIAIAPPADPLPLATALHAAQQGHFHWLILTSTNAVEQVAPHLHPPYPFRLATVGSATAADCVQQLGIEPAVVPDQFVAEALAAALGSLHGQRVLLAQADIARPVLAEQLQQAGAELVQVVAYRTVPATGGEDVPALLRQGQIHALTFTSGSTVRYFVARIEQECPDADEVLAAARQCVIACIGPIAAAAAAQISLPPTVVAAPHTTAGLVQALCHAAHQRSDYTKAD